MATAKPIANSFDHSTPIFSLTKVMSDHAKHPTIVRAVATKPPVDTQNGIPQKDAWSLLWKHPFIYVSLTLAAEYAARLRFVTPLMNAVMYPLLWPLTGFDASYTGVPLNREIASLSLFYVLIAWGATVTMSIMGQCMGNSEGYQNKEPRLNKISLRGLPHRLTALHANLLETFPVFVICAVFTYMMEPFNPHLIELLSIHVFAKILLYIPFYAADLDLLRSSSHTLAIGACIRILTIIALSK